MGGPLLAHLQGAPLAAYPLHEYLRDAAANAAHASLHRLGLLTAWLGIWGSTATPPDGDALRPLVENAPDLTALAMARAAGAPDPVAAACEFLASHDPRNTTAAAWGRDFIALVAHHADRSSDAS